VSIAFIILLATLTNAANVLNSSPINSNGFPVNVTAKPPTTNEKKTVIVAPPDATTTGIYGNPYLTGRIFPITIHGGRLVGILADENMASMILVLDPRNMTIELPRIVIVP
jgi:hypothetical protein